LKEGIFMAKKNENRVLVTLSCSECKNQNYTVSKNKKNTTEKLKLNKYCSKCQKTTEHTEKK
jgi:large subunit ribosomal protein L33